MIWGLGEHSPEAPSWSSLSSVVEPGEEISRADMLPYVGLGAPRKFGPRETMHSLGSKDNVPFIPKPWDVEPRKRTRGDVPLGNWDQNDLVNAEFLRSHHGYEDGWVGKRMLGAGTEGRAGLWEKRDGDGKVIDVSSRPAPKKPFDRTHLTVPQQICIKQTKAEYLVDYQWRKPVEVMVLEDLNKRRRNGTVKLRAYRRYPRSTAHRLYLQYCQYGNLNNLIVKYRIKK
ncbi:MAG: hypothetical protein Q9220_005616 [cf. Caloplaca sp. 1 TL-2023]